MLHASRAMVLQEIQTVSQSPKNANFENATMMTMSNLKQRNGQCVANGIEKSTRRFNSRLQEMIYRTLIAIYGPILAEMQTSRTNRPVSRALCRC
jgi:hypothetical protein